MKTIRATLFFFVFFGLALASPLQAQESDGNQLNQQPLENPLKEAEMVLPRSTYLTIEAGTMAPIWAGGVVGLRFFNKTKIFAGYGLVPRAYVDLIGQTVAASSGGNQDLAKVVGEAFTSNRSWILGAEYDIGFPAGFGLGFVSQQLSSQGSSDVDTIGGATGKDLSDLRTLMIAASVSTKVRLQSDLNLAWIYSNYSWMVGERLLIEGSFGVAKIIQAKETINTGWDDFNTSDTGRLLLGQAENDLEETLVKNGITPLVGISAQFVF